MKTKIEKAKLKEREREKMSYKCSTKTKGDIPYVILIINVRSTVSLTGLFNEVHTDETSMVKCFYISLYCSLTQLSLSFSSFYFYFFLYSFLNFTRFPFGDFIATIFCSFLFELVGGRFSNPTSI